MKPLSGDKQLGVASPLKCAAIQSGKTNHPSMDKNEVGLDVSHHIHLSLEGRGKYFFLDILFHRMSYRDFPRNSRYNDGTTWFRADHADYLALCRSLLRTQGLCVGVQRHLCC